MPSHLFRAPLPTHRPPTAIGETQANGVNTPDQPPRSENPTRRSSNGLLAGIKEGLGKAFLPSEEIRKGKALRKAVKAGNFQRTKEKLERGANPNMKSSNYFNSALHVAAKNKNWQIAKLLVEYGANPKQPNLAGETPESIARTNQDVSMHSTFVSTQAAMNPDAFFDPYLPPYQAEPEAFPVNPQIMNESPSFHNYDNVTSASGEPPIRGAKDVYTG